MPIRPSGRDTTRARDTELVPNWLAKSTAVGTQVLWSPATGWNRVWALPESRHIVRRIDPIVLGPSVNMALASPDQPPTMEHSEFAAFEQEMQSKVRQLYASPLITAGFKSSMLDNPHTKSTIHFRPGFCRPVASQIKTDHTLFIIFANRSGSNYLADLIRTTGRYNVAGEVFNHDQIIKRSTDLGLESFGAYLDVLKKNAVNGRFACKASLAQFVFLYASSFLDSHFPERTVVLTQREDKIAQAISFWIAHHTKQWTSLQPVKKVDVPFDINMITRIIRSAYDDEKNSRVALSLLGQEFTTANYEHIQGFPNFIVRMILSKCGLEKENVDFSKVRLKRQSGPLNKEFRERYISHFSNVASKES